VRQRLGDDYVVALGMRYQNPSIASAIDELLAAGVDELVVFPLFPQYAGATTGSVHEEVMRVLSQKENIPNVRLINSYYNHPEMVRIFADHARAFDLKTYDHFIFSYHGLPQRQLRRADAGGAHCTRQEGCC
jgi:ferrochelatase